MSNASKRLFVAIMPEPEVQHAIAGQVQQYARRLGDFRFTSAEQIHLTLLFLGDVPNGRISELAKVVSLVAREYSPMRLTMQGIGAFPNLLKPNILWLGVQTQSTVSHEDSQGSKTQPTNQSLRAIHRDLAEQLVLNDFDFDDKPLSPHVTIGRAPKANALRAIDQVALELRTVEFAQIEVHELCLVASELHASGSRYQILAICPLRGNGA